MPRAPLVPAVLLLIAVGGGCGGEDLLRPIARPLAAPAYLPFGDGYHTDLVLDGTASSDPADETRAAPLRYRWEIDDPAPALVSGTLASGRLTVRLAAAAATRVRLTVTGAGGASASAIFYVGVTLPR